MTIKEALQYIISQIAPVYASGEAANIAELVIENITGISKKERAVAKDRELTSLQPGKIEPVIQRLLSHEPIQYILNEAWFCGLKFYVDKNVLIPRPETEELVEWVISGCKFPLENLRILDIGSGSGCIPITLKRRLRKADVWGCDISGDALTIARRNADALDVAVDFLQLDFLDEKERMQLPKADIIVSNPPYVPLRDKPDMNKNVTDYEPGLALFVPDKDPLVFYNAIAGFAKTHLHPGGKIYVEIHEESGNAVAEIFIRSGYAVVIKKDMQGKERMLVIGH
jgi:release factor glutamine methyltransferase